MACLACQKTNKVLDYDDEECDVLFIGLEVRADPANASV